MTTTPRQVTAALAVAAACITAAIATVAADDRTRAAAAVVAVVHVVAAVVAAARPGAVLGPVLTGTGLAWAAVLGPLSAAGGVVVVTGVVATGELLGAAGELGVTVARPSAPAIHAAGRATLVAAIVATLVALATALPVIGT